jgi:hypothetical protein
MTVAVAGLGVVSTLGIGRNLRVDHADATDRKIDLRDVRAGIAQRGLGLLSPPMQLALRGATEAVADAGYASTLPHPSALVVGTNRAHHASIAEMLNEVLETHHVSLARGLNGSISTLAARLAIVFKTRAFACTLPSDRVAGLDAVLEGARMVRDGRATASLAGGTEALAAMKPGCADGAAFAVLEQETTLATSGRRARGHLLGWASSGAPAAGSTRLRCAVAVIRRALAGVSVASALLSGGPGEEEALAAVFHDAEPPVRYLPEPLPRVGAAVGVFQLAAALSSNDDRPVLLVNFAPGKLLAAVVASNAKSNGETAFVDS